MHFRIIEKSECGGISVQLVRYSLRSKSRIYQKKIVKGFYFDATSPPDSLLTPNKKTKQHKKSFRCVLVLWFLSSHLQFWSDSIQILPSHSAKATCQSEKGDVVWRFGSEQMLRQITHCVEGRRGLCVKRWVSEGGWRRNNYTSTRLFVSSASSSERAAVIPSSFSSSCVVANGTFELLPSDVNADTSDGSLAKKNDQDFILFKSSCLSRTLIKHKTVIHHSVMKTWVLLNIYIYFCAHRYIKKQYKDLFIASGVTVLKI